MVTLKIALRSLLRRKVRMVLIGLLVFLGTMLIVMGETFSLSTSFSSKKSIIDNFTGDVILYSSKAKEKPTPFAFNSPLPVIGNSGHIEAWLDSNGLCVSHVAIAQNYGMMSIDKNGKKTDVPFIFYAVDPVKYYATFKNVSMQSGTFYNSLGTGIQEGVVLSVLQQQTYKKNYAVDLNEGDAVTLLSIGDAGSVNAQPSRIVGIYKPKYYSNVFNYINFLDITSYSRLYNFTGVDSASLPASVNNALAQQTDDDIFGLAGNTSSMVETSSLVSKELSGYTTIAVKLKEGVSGTLFRKRIAQMGFDVKCATWEESAGFFAYIGSLISGVIYGATILIFIIVIFILMNTLIINVLERTGEIGTLRAMGAEKGFVRLIFLWESFLLNGIASFAGMFASFVLIAIIAAGKGVILPDVVQQYLTGGAPLKLILSIRPFAEAIGLVGLVSVLATVYPVRVATKITPLKAMSDK